MKLWEFQEEAVDECRRRFAKERRLLLCSPTGSGKTVLACALAKASIGKGKTVCILVDRKEILKQFAKALANFQLYPELVVAGSTNIRRTNLYLGMVESFDRRFMKSAHLQNIDFFILDEAHSTAYFKIIKKSLGRRPHILGLTATPVLTGTKERLNDHYEGIVELAKVEQLIKLGKLCDSKTYSIDLKNEAALKKAKGDYTETSQLELMDQYAVRDGVVENFMRICPNGRFICYNINVEHSRKMAGLFNFHGIKCRHIDGETDPAYREETFDMLNSGEIQGVHNFGICTTGFDEPAVDTIIQNFATNSLSKHIQTAGRGARIFPNKTHFNILDMGRNFSRHGLWNRNKDWTDIFKNPHEADERDRQQTERLHNVNCTTCGYIVSPDMEACPICGAVVATMLTAKLTKKGDGQPTRAELQLIKEQAKAALPPHLKGRRPETMSYSELDQYAQHMGYDPKWKFMILRKSRKRFKDDFGNQ